MFSVKKCPSPTPPVSLTPSPSGERDATDIQRVFRAYQARKSFLSQDLHPQYVRECADAETRFTPMATDGKTPVYLPYDLTEVVLKEAGREKAIERFQKMQHVRSILQAEKCSHLVIPKARLHQGFLIEERLPLNSRSYYNTKLYAENRDLFDQPVREMVRLFAKSFIPHLVNIRNDKVNNTLVVEDIRYDNISFYPVTQKGKTKMVIALPDLERAGTREEKKSQTRLIILGTIFPYHQETIMDEATKLSMHFERENIEKACSIGAEYQSQFDAPLEDPESGRSCIPAGRYLYP